MIRFNLICEKDHEFEGWFSNSADFDNQQQRKLVACPMCNSSKVTKALMTPSVPSRKSDKIPMAHMDSTRKALFAEMKKLRDHVTANSEDVGEKFPEEARKIHYGETEERGIYGAASAEEAKDLVEEGISVAPLPVLPEDGN